MMLFYSVENWEIWRKCWSVEYSAWVIIMMLAKWLCSLGLWKSATWRGWRSTHVFCCFRFRVAITFYEVTNCLSCWTKHLTWRNMVFAYLGTDTLAFLIHPCEEKQERSVLLYAFVCEERVSLWHKYEDIVCEREREREKERERA